MANNVRTVDFLPEIFQTPANRQFLNATLDQLVQEPAFQKTQGYVGRKVGPGVNSADKYVIEPTKSRNDYQLEPGVISLDSDTLDIKDAITYPGINDALKLQGANVSNPDSLYKSNYYTWDPFVDFDKFVNYSQYYWEPAGPLAVDVSASTIPLTDDFVVTRENGVYTFSGISGNNPTLTLVHGGNYTFQVAQNNKETINFRVSNNGASAFVIDYEPNPTLTLVRGNTYTFTMVLNQPFPFYIKTTPSLGNTNLFNNGVTNNGAVLGTITFVVPQDAPDTLYYANSTQANMQGVFNIIDATPGTGAGFWIQSDPGVNGRLPYAPNISSRDVLGVTNNGEDLGTVTFNVPPSTAQNFYYSLAPIGNISGKTTGTVDLVTTLNFNEINNIFLEPFFANNPNGIDGITSLDGKTVVFLNQQQDAESGGWLIDTFFDPLVNAGNTVSSVGSYDSTTFSETTPITSQSARYSVWQIQYVTTSGGVYMQLNNVLAVNNLQKFSILYGTQYSSTSWYKNASGYFEEIPLLTAIKNLLWYQDGTDPEIFGQIRIINQDLTDIIFIEDILGKKNYTSPNGVVFTNGLKVTFRGNVEPVAYQNNSYYVEGVGTAIQLLPVTDFVTPETYTKSATVPYDSTPYDLGNFDATLNAPIVPDYLTISRASPDLNAWSRSNRWFHIDVITYSCQLNGIQPTVDNLFRARRPILEFRAGTRLFNFGTQAVTPVDIIDFQTTDALSTINGTTGYSVDGYIFAQGSLVIFAADTDPQVRNQIYEVQFITPDPAVTPPIINLVPATDNKVLVDQTTVCLSGETLQGLSFWFDGVDWFQAQEKTGVNQSPLFDVYDSAEISFGNRVKYPSTTFRGSKLFSYATSNTSPDAVLGFPLRYLSLSNIGDIVFDNNLYTDTFDYVYQSVGQTQYVSEGFVRQYNTRLEYTKEIGWQSAVTQSLIRQQFQFSYDGTPLRLDIKVNTNTTVPAIQLYVNSQFEEPTNYSYITTDTTTTITLNRLYVPGDVIEVAVLSDQISPTAFYQVPVNLENNPFNDNSKVFTLGTIRTHYETIGQNLLTIQGPIIGANNTRDLGNIVPYGLQILQQGSPLTLAGYFMRSQEYDIFASLEYNSREYIKYKSLLLETVARNEYPEMTIAEILDSAIAEITSGRTDINPFYWSDMFPTGSVFTQTVDTIGFVSTATFNTIQTYNFTSANFKGLLVYLTRGSETRLLTRDLEYVVSPDSPRFTVTVPLEVGDVITINEYADTAGNFCPNTPTKMGLYPKYVPRIYVSDNYLEPQLVIEGHDGSITMAFGDFRDDILLEFERRIYDNIKMDGNPIPLSAEDVIPGFFRTTDYSQTETTGILGESFLTWVGWNKLNYKAQDYQPSDAFTYNYSTAGNKINSEPLLGAWRGIYRYFYDTITPNYTPWEMLGLSVQPDWWENRYGPAPYTSDNLVLWDDLEAGLVADPVAPYVKPAYRRPGLTQVIPVGTEGELLDPLQSVVGPYNPTDFQKSWSVGDGGPVEASWWQSSSYPFAVMRLLILTRPAEFFSLFADRDLYKYDFDLEQYLYNGRYRLNASGVQVYGNGVSKASYINWIVDYNQQLGRNSTTALTNDLASLDVRLCYRMASFSDKQYLSLYVERSSPDSTNSSLLLPDDSYNLLLYKNQPFSRVVYSSLIVEQTENGYIVYGYNNATPYFNVFASSSSGVLQTVSSGGATVRVPAQYTNTVVQIPYGYTFINTTMMVDFILSYGAWLESQGLVFDERVNNYTLNWNQMAKEFLYWSQQGWTPGTIINLNPAANTLKAYRAGAVVDTIVSTSPENVILDQNKQRLPTRDLIVQRYGDTFSVTSASSQAISFLDMKFTNYENMVVLDNVSIFQDLVYDPTTAARQNRVRMTGATSTDWNGVLNAQGFILNQNNVKQWQPNKKYTKGEIVLYKTNYWSAQTIVQPKLEFESNDWVKSDYTKIQKGLLPNLANKADQLANSYNTNSANLERDNDLLSYGLIGFRPRQYMTDLNLNDVSQVNLYQQFLGTKGTIRAAELFTYADLGKETGAYEIFENWAILIGTYGANANRSFIELRLNEAYLRSDPSTVQVIQPQQPSLADQTILLNDVWRESYRLTSTDILPTTYVTNQDTALPSAGYVNLDDVDVTVFDINDPASIAADINNIGVGTTIWIAKINSYNWGVYRCARVPGQLTQITDNLNSTSVAEFSGLHGLSVGDLIVIRYFNESVNGVYRVLSVPSITSVIISYSFINTSQTTITGNGMVFDLQTMRVSQASDVASLDYVNSLLPGARAYVDNNGSGHWEVLEKQNPFSSTTQLLAQTPIPNSKFGTSIAQSENLFAAMIGSPMVDTGTVYTYRQNSGNTNYTQDVLLTLNATGTQGFGNAVDFGKNQWAAIGASASNNNQGYVLSVYRDLTTNAFRETQLLVRPSPSVDPIKFGSSVAVSTDERWLYVGAPADANGGKVYCFNRVDVEVQTIQTTTNGVDQRFLISDNIVIDYTQSAQLIVVLNRQTATYGVDYVIQQNPTGLPAGYYVTFTTIPPEGSLLSISRRPGVELVGDGTAGPFSLTPYLYTVTNIDSITVIVNGVIQRPYIDYEFNNDSNLNTQDLTFNTIPGVGDPIFVIANTHWQYVDTISVAGLPTDAQFGISVSTTVDGRGIFVGANVDDVSPTSNAGSVYAFDRSVVKYIVQDTALTTYSIPTPATSPVLVILNNEFLNIQSYTEFGITKIQFIDGQVNVNLDNNTVTFLNPLSVGDVIEIETNQFKQIQKISANTPQSGSLFGSAVDICPTSCSLYVGNPLDSTILLEAGSVDRNINQSRLYGVTTSLIANPTLVAGQSIRINDVAVVVPQSPNNTVKGLAEAISPNPYLSTRQYVLGDRVTYNNFYYVALSTTVGNAPTNTTYWTLSTPVPNAIATVTPNLIFTGDNNTKTFEVGTIYSAADSYTTVVYIGSTLQTAGVDYVYNSTTKQIVFVDAPVAGSVITIVSGRLTLSVLNLESSTPGNRLTVLPGITGTLFDTLGFDTFVYAQTILSPNAVTYAQFGSSLNIDTNAVNLVVGAPNGNVYEPVTFDGGKTYFDERSTTFFSPVFNSGVVYSYDYLPSANGSATNPGMFVFGQQIYTTDLVSQDQFGTALNYTSGRLMVGAPGNDLGDSALNYGLVSVFNNPDRDPAWKVIHIQQPSVDVNQINSVYMYDRLVSSTQTYFDFIDPLQGKVLGAARRNIDYIGAVDPANYTNGTIRNQGNSWGAEHVGEMWWDTDTVRFIDPNQDNIVYASRRWGQTFPGSRVDIYQWVASDVPPLSYTGAGTVLSTSSYTVRSALSKENIFVTTYYFWVRNISTVDTGAGKTLSATGVARYIENPRNSGIPYIAALNSSTIALYNALEYISAADTIIHVEFDQELNDANIHTEYDLIADGQPDSFLNATLYRKLIDSFSGVDTRGAPVPDPMLSPAERYGVQFRPRQSMFADRFMALENYLVRTNTILAQYPITENRSFNLLNSFEPPPEAGSGAWDANVANLEELSYQNIYAVPLGYLYLVDSAATQNGLWSIYQVVLDENLQVDNPGLRTVQLTRVENYDTRRYWDHIDWYLPGYNSTKQPIAEVPVYSALDKLTLTEAPVGSSVKVRANAQGKFEIYLRTDLGWDRVGLQDGTIQFSEKLWNYALGRYGFDVEVFDAQYFDQEPVIETRKIIQAINDELFVDELAIERNRNLILMFNYIYSEFTAPDWLIKTSLVDVEHRIRALLPFQNYLEDNQTFVLDYIQEVKPYHVKIRQFDLTYYGDDTYPGSLTDFDVPAYWKTENIDVPQYVSPVLQFDESGQPYYLSTSIVESTTSDAPPNAEIWTFDPWKQWYNNYLLDLQDITIVDGGSGYTVAPDVKVYVDGVEQATNIQAVVNSAGRVIAINIIDAAGPYIVTPIIKLTGGNGYGALAVAVMGNQPLALGKNLARSILTTIKYDRYQYTSNITDWSYAVATYPQGTQVRHVNRVWEATATITNDPVITSSVGAPDSYILTVTSNVGLSTGMLAVAFGIPADTYIATINGNSISLTRVLLDTIDSAVTFYNTFNPVDWTRIPSGSSYTIDNITYPPLSGVDRTQGFYVPGPNEPGLNLPLLIDGIDYPGVQVSAPGFNQNTGFDVGNYDINPFDNIFLSPAGYPTYDLAILDAIYESSYRDIYLGTRATDVNVDGGAYVDPYSSHAPEELIPGAEFDTLDFKVYTRPGADWEGRGHGFPEEQATSEFDLLNPTISWATTVLVPAQIVVSNRTTKTDLVLNIDYTADWANQTVTITSGASTGDVIIISVYGVGGGNQLYQQLYNGSEVGNTLIVPVAYDQLQEFAIFVNGVFLPESTEDSTLGYTYQPYYAPGVTVTYNPVGSSGTTLVVTDTLDISVGSLIVGNGFTSGQTVTSKINTTVLEISASPDSAPNGNLEFKPNSGSTKITFSDTYDSTDSISLIAIGPTGTEDYSWSTPQSQVIIANGTLTYTLDNSLEYSNPDNLIVTVNGVRARTSAGVEYIGDGIIDTFLLPDRLGFSQNFIADNQVDVYVNNIPQILNIDFIVNPYTGPGRTITFTTVDPPVGQILICVSTGTQAYVDGNQLVFTGDGIIPIAGDVIEVITWNDTRQQNILTTVYVGPISFGAEDVEPFASTEFDVGNITNDPGSYDYSSGTVVTINDLQLGRPTTDASRLWVTLNGQRLFPNSGYTINGEELILTSGLLRRVDVIMITQFTENIVPAAMAFRIFQDMRGVQATYRITDSTTTTLVQDLSATDDVIYVADASALPQPGLAAAYNNFAQYYIGDKVIYNGLFYQAIANTQGNLPTNTSYWTGSAGPANIWGVIMIEGERIMYRDRNLTNNTVSSLLRGTAGTAAADHLVDSFVTDLGRGNLLPEPYQNYVDSNITNPLVSGVNLGDGVYNNGVWTGTTVFSTEIDLSYEDSSFDATAIEVYVGGTRVTEGYTILSDNPVTVEFDVPPLAGVEVLILVRRGVWWYNVAQPDQSLQETDTPAARFLRGQ